jgi:transposase
MNGFILVGSVTSEDSTSLSVTGEYAQDVDDHTLRITHGYSKDHRPDLKQIIHELLVRQNARVQLMMKCWDGNASELLIKYFNQTQQLCLYPHPLFLTKLRVVEKGCDGMVCVSRFMIYFL